jgi:hypothetical protein
MGQLLFESLLRLGAIFEPDSSPSDKNDGFSEAKLLILNWECHCSLMWAISAVCGLLLHNLV